jgi:hypothetical protein
MSLEKARSWQVKVYHSAIDKGHEEHQYISAALAPSLARAVTLDPTLTRISHVASIYSTSDALAIDRFAALIWHGAVQASAACE